MQVLVLRRYAKILSVAAGLFCAAGPALAQQMSASQGVMGWWLDQTGKAGILISQCGSKLCGKIEWLKKPLNENGTPVLDIHNDNAALRSRKVCDLTMLGNFTTDGHNAWHGGWIYDPASGNTYKSVMHLGADGRLHVRGYIGIPLFGRSEIWTRPTAKLTLCSQA